MIPARFHSVVLSIALLLLCSTSVLAQSVSPGPLSSDHASLEGIDSCKRCHSRGEAISTTNCLGCHKALGKQVGAGAGYHPRAKGTCAGCHPDHRGRKAPLVRWPGGDESKFAHLANTKFDLKGKHKNLECRGCHKPALHKSAVARLLMPEERPRTYLGLRTDCVDCHEDVHKPTLGSDCKSCHDESAWGSASDSKEFDHGKTRFALRGGHAEVACAKCHGGTDKAIAKRKIPFAACTDCHTDPHAGRMKDPKKKARCTGCHDEKKWSQLLYDKGTHLPRSFPLQGGHQPPTCADCHGERLDRTLQTRCASCHDDPHKPSLGSKCESCHSIQRWVGKATKKRIDFHDRTSYPLVGKHGEVACAKCHKPTTPLRRRYRPIVHDQCIRCHADPHLGEASKTCEGCHDLDGFAPATFGAKEHAKTHFPLAGAHRAVPCLQCHPAAPASPGFRRSETSCQSCHEDPHGGQFAKEHTECTDCHDDKAWAPSRFDKKQHSEAGFPLTKKHDVACARCHGAAKGEVARFVDLPADCGACHEDRHLGQFEGRACTTCHSGASFQPARGFRHAATFPLRGRHAAAPCKSCHPQAKIATRRTEVYLLGAQRRECVGCHALTHGEALSRRPQARALAAATTECSACHDEATWASVRSGPSFPHETTGAPLVGGHAKTPCASCHRPGQDLGEMVACSQCHRDRHNGRLGDRCEQCHSPASWAPDRILVDHQKTRLPLMGAHAVQACGRCHQDKARGDFRGLDPACGSCHQKTVVERAPHPPHIGRAFFECGDCHSQLGWRPAHVNHDVFWPLTGAHRSKPCASCHTSDRPGFSAPRECASCHASDLASSSFNHSSVDSSRCERCHSTSAWRPADFPDHDRLFPLRGHHDLPCDSCHTRPNMIQVYSCIDCHAHRRASTDREHREVGGYTYVSTECYRCHQRGRGD